MTARANEHTLLMFSGGRDSTLAAVRLAGLGVPLTLCTVSSSHLSGFGRVRSRLKELKRLLPESTQWTRVRQPTRLATDTSFYERTCLPCHHAYVVASGVLARLAGARVLAFGYAGYQSDWPEQTPQAVYAMRRVLSEFGMNLDLPVLDLTSREAAIAELHVHGLSPDAMEQKCSRQVSNVALPHDLLTRQVTLWEDAMRESLLRMDDVDVEVVEHGLLRDAT